MSNGHSDQRKLSYHVCLLSSVSVFKDILMKFRHVMKTAWFQSAIVATHPSTIKVPRYCHKKLSEINFLLLLRSYFRTSFDIFCFKIPHFIMTSSFQEKYPLLIKIPSSQPYSPFLGKFPPFVPSCKAGLKLVEPTLS